MSTWNVEAHVKLMLCSRRFTEESYAQFEAMLNGAMKGSGDSQPRALVKGKNTVRNRMRSSHQHCFLPRRLEDLHRTNWQHSTRRSLVSACFAHCENMQQ